MISIDGPSNREQNNLEEFVRDSLFTGPLFIRQDCNLSEIFTCRVGYRPNNTREWSLGWGKTKKFCTGKAVESWGNKIEQVLTTQVLFLILKNILTQAIDYQNKSCST